jgi:hypothetical protein
MEDLKCLCLFRARAWALGHNNIIRVGAELLRTLRQGQNGVGRDNKLRFFELLLALAYHLRLAMDEKDADRAAPVRRSAVRRPRNVKL